jgi:hypothetical protein
MDEGTAPAFLIEADATDTSEPAAANESADDGLPDGLPDVVDAEPNQVDLRTFRVNSPSYQAVQVIIIIL